MTSLKYKGRIWKELYKISKFKKIMFNTEIKIVLRRGIMSKENKTQQKTMLTST